MRVDWYRVATGVIMLCVGGGILALLLLIFRWAGI